MHPKPSKFLTFCFSLLPGAGHMYLGLMKRGLSFMILFFATIAATFLSSSLRLEPFMFAFALAIPIVWFAAFFDLWRYPRMTAEEKAAQQDEFLFMQEPTVQWKPIARKLCVLGGVLLILAAVQQVIQHYIMRLFTQWHWWNIQPAIGAAIMLALGIAAIVIFTRKPKQLPQQQNEVHIESETEH
ncbi:MAG: hypothetical protein FWE40_02125 [Oscillospiraceae bacterium]|nr:hypothetical protein [Oscillospiraceae bacterium]